MSKRWKRVLSALCAFAMVFSNGVCDLFAIADETEQLPSCGRVEHEHTEGCYRGLICGQEETAPSTVERLRYVGNRPHQHSGGCYVDGVLACGLVAGSSFAGSCQAPCASS